MRWIYLVGFTCLLLGCAPHTHTPASLTTPEYHKEEIIYRYAFNMTKPLQQVSLEYRDETLLCRLLPKELNIELNIVNLSEEPFSINWNDVRLIDPEGVSHPILHDMVILSDVRRENLPSLILPQGVLDESVAPIENVALEFSGWTQKPLFPKTEEAMNLKGSTFGVSLPVKQEDETRNYLFEFQVTEVFRVVLVN